MDSHRCAPPLRISRAELRRRVIEHDSRLIAEGHAPFQRPLSVSMAIAREIGVTWTLGPDGSDPVTDAVHEIYRELYRPQDLYMPPIHVGAVMFRDVFFRLLVPVAFGTVAIEPFGLVDGMPETQKRWMASEPAELGRFIDQAVDLFDFGYGLDDFSKMHAGKEEAVDLLKLGRAHLEAAANACVGSVDPYAVAQNALIAAELLMKGALRAAGCGEAELKAIGHDLVALGAAFSAREPAADAALIGKVCASLPRLVTHRYRRLDLGRVQIGDVVMKAQYLAGEVMRRLSGRDTRLALRVDALPPPVPRTFPA